MYDLIRTKRAVRDFSDEPIPTGLARRIVNAGRLSGSAKNSQPWHFVVTQDRATLEALAECGAYAGHLAGAAMGVALVTTDPFRRITIPFDLGRATQNMMLTAWEEGIGSVMASIYQPHRAGEILGIPREYKVCWCVSFGYPATPQNQPPDPAGRKDADEVIHWGQW